MVEIGEWAPDFSVFDHRGNEFRLSDMRGKRVILSFHPLAWTGVCTEQMRALEENWQVFESLDAVAVGISVDSVPCKSAWAEGIGIQKTRLLADFWPHGDVAQAYGVFDGLKGVARRSNIVVDEFQHVIFTRTYDTHAVPDMREIVAVLGEQELSRREDLHLPKI